MIDPGFDEYVRVFGPQVDMETEKLRKAYSDVLNPLREVSMVQSYLNDHRPSPPPSEPRAFYVLGTLTVQLLEGIYASLGLGAPVAAATCFRSLFEVLLSAKLIAESDSVNRSSLYMNFEKHLRGVHLDRGTKAGVSPPPEIDVDKAKAEAIAVRGDYDSTGVHWWSKIMWTSEKDRKKSFGTSGAAAYLDKKGVPSGIDRVSFAELGVRWFSTFSSVAHGSIAAANVMPSFGGRPMAWKLNPDSVRLAALAVAAGAEVISVCEEGRSHPKFQWSRVKLKSIAEAALEAQLRLENQPIR